MDIYISTNWWNKEAVSELNTNAKMGITNLQREQWFDMDCKINHEDGCLCREPSKVSRRHINA